MLRSVIAIAFLAGSVPALAQPIEVVATFSILADMTRNVGGERVAVTTLVGPGGDPHVFQPTPQEARAIAEADLVVVNGLGFESWLDRLVEASGYDGPIVVASQRVTPLSADSHDHDEGDAHANHAQGEDHAGEVRHEDDEVYDPHAWQDLGNARLYVAAIADGLAAADPEGAGHYAANAERYDAEIAALAAEATAAFAALGSERRTVLTNHDAFAYLAAAYDLSMVAPQGLSTEAEPSARDVAALVREIRADGVDAIFLESATDGRLMARIAAETGATVGGELYADTLSPPAGPASTYLAMMRHNVGALTTALGD